MCVSGYAHYKLNRLFRAYLIIALAAVLQGCTASFPSATSASSEEALESTRESEPTGSPFTLEILDEVNDGDTISIRGRVIARVVSLRDEILLRLSTLDDAGDSKTILRRLSDLSPTELKGSESTQTEFVISAPSRGVSNYQIELLWGQDAAPLLAQATVSAQEQQQVLALRKLEVHRVPSDACAIPDECSVKFTITGEFFNPGRALVRSVVIEAGFAPADKLDLPQQILENARRIEVRNLNLVPGGVKPFRLALQKLIPSSEQVAPRPVVRIISVDAT